MSTDEIIEELEGEMAIYKRSYAELDGSVRDRNALATIAALEAAKATVEAAHWWDARLVKPDAYIAVLCGFADEEVDLGYWDGKHWRGQDNLRFAGRVEFWCHTPSVPVRAVAAPRVDPDVRDARERRPSEKEVHA